jgi:O-antigen/teichoic acid export membrane protein
LQGQALRGVAWVTLGTLGRHALKLASSLILTRLLLPDAFGLMATLGVLMAGVEMCSDFGLRQALIQHTQGEQRRVLDTAWTLMLLRSAAISLVLALLAHPFATLMQAPLLAGLTLAYACTPVLRALASPAALRWGRELDQKRLTQVELTAETIRVAASIAGALALQSVWGLVLGGITGELARTLATYALGGERPAWRLERAAAGALLRFGRFVMLSSIIGFLALRLDALLVARFLGMEAAGFYAIAGVMALVLDQVGSSIANQVLFPALSRRQDRPEVVRERTGQALDAVLLLLLGCVLLAFSSELIIAILYKAIYAPAAQPLPWLLLAAGLSTLANTLNCPLMASGKPQYGTLACAVRLAVFAAAAVRLAPRLGAAGYAGAAALSAGAFALAIGAPAIRLGHVTAGRVARTIAAPAALAAVLWLVHVLAGEGTPRWAVGLIDFVLAAAAIYGFRAGALQLLGHGGDAAPAAM